MVKSYCVKQKKGAEGAGILGTTAEQGMDAFVHHAIQFMPKKSVEMTRCYDSEALRNKNLQKKAINYGLKKLTPMIENVGHQALDQLSTKIRPKLKYKTNRKDLDVGAIDIHKASGKLSRPKAGFTPGKYKYMGRTTPLDKQLKYDPNTDKV